MKSEATKKKCANLFFGIKIITSCALFLISFLAILIVYKLIDDLIISFKQPVRSIVATAYDKLDAPAIVIFPIGATFKACKNFEGLVSSSKAHVDDFPLENRSCIFTNLTYTDPWGVQLKYPVVATILRGPDNYAKKQAVFTHFQLNDSKRNFVVINYMIFENYDKFAKLNKEQQVERMIQLHKTKPTYSLSAGFRQWVKFRLVSTEMEPGVIDHHFAAHQSIIKYYWTKDVPVSNGTFLFFTFFEWETNLVDESRLMYTTSVWSVIASMCSILLGVHKAAQVATASFNSIRVSFAERRQERANQSLERTSLNNDSTALENLKPA